MIAKERNIPYELILVNLETGEHKQPAHLEHQPFGQVPYIAVRCLSSPVLPRIVTMSYTSSLTFPPLLE
jgi:hypothetical protein